MKKLYWRPQRASLRVLWLVALLAIGGLFMVEKYRTQQEQPFFREKVRASQLAAECFKAIKDERLKRDIPIDPESDPTMSGLIGELLTPVTTNPGHLPSKQTAVNPNFAAVVVHLLKRIGVEPGDVVALGISGSFPAENVAVLAAVQSLELRPILISSVGSSQWGANNPKFLWPEMEQLLYDQHLINFRSVALSRGGLEDKALGMTKEGKEIIDRAIDRSGIAKIEAKSYAESVERRMEIYLASAGDKGIKAYINVGGGTASVGARLGRKLFKPGLNRTMPQGASEIDSVMARFIANDVPVIHIMNIDKLAQRYGLPLEPKTMPAVGQGKIFVREVHNRWLALGTTIFLILVLIAFVRFDWGYRIFTAGSRERTSTRPQKMV